MLFCSRGCGNKNPPASGGGIKKHYPGQGFLTESGVVESLLPPSSDAGGCGPV